MQYIKIFLLTIGLVGHPSRSVGKDLDSRCNWGRNLELYCGLSRTCGEVACNCGQQKEQKVITKVWNLMMKGWNGQSEVWMWTEEMRMMRQIEEVLERVGGEAGDSRPGTNDETCWTTSTHAYKLVLSLSSLFFFPPPPLPLSPLLSSLLTSAPFSCPPNN